jgi:hypothetical protein
VRPKNLASRVAVIHCWAGYAIVTTFLFYDFKITLQLQVEFPAFAIEFYSGEAFLNIAFPSSEIKR